MRLCPKGHLAPSAAPSASAAARALASSCASALWALASAANRRVLYRQRKIRKGRGTLS